MKNTEIWLFIFILGLLGLNWPLLEIFRIEVVTYLFVFWALFIILVAFATYKAEEKRLSSEFRVNELKG